MIDAESQKRMPGKSQSEDFSGEDPDSIDIEHTEERARARASRKTLVVREGRVNRCRHTERRAGQESVRRL
jgi:hypothetical protein